MHSVQTTKSSSSSGERSVYVDPVPVTLILGMHRSGTSSLAGCLQECGLQLGQVVEQAPHNRKGNRENLEFRAINDQALAESGGSWDNPPDALSWSDQTRRRRDAAIAAYQRYESWGLKDPRTLLTLPFWLEGLKAVRFVATFRHPVAVADSLSQRNGLSFQAGLDLWKAYNLKLVQCLQGETFPVVCFDWPACDYLMAVSGIARSLGLTEHQSQGRIEFFDENLRNEHRVVSDRPLPADVISIHKRLIAVAQYTLERGE